MRIRTAARSTPPRFLEAVMVVLQRNFENSDTRSGSARCASARRHGVGAAAPRPVRVITTQPRHQPRRKPHKSCEYPPQSSRSPPAVRYRRSRPRRCPPKGGACSGAIASICHFTNGIRLGRSRLPFPIQIRPEDARPLRSRPVGSRRRRLPSPLGSGDPGGGVARCVEESSRPWIGRSWIAREHRSPGTLRKLWATSLSVLHGKEELDRNPGRGPGQARLALRRPSGPGIDR
jgi:hypothetical protein